MVFKKINKNLKEELAVKKKELGSELKEAEDIYLRKEHIRKKLYGKINEDGRKEPGMVQNAEK